MHCEALVDLRVRTLQLFDERGSLSLENNFGGQFPNLDLEKITKTLTIVGGGLFLPTGLTALPPEIIVHGDLAIVNQNSLTHLRRVTVRGDIFLQNCPSLERIERITAGGGLTVYNCQRLVSLSAAAARQDLTVLRCPLLSVGEGVQVWGNLLVEAINYRPGVFVGKGTYILPPEQNTAGNICTISPEW